MGCIHSADTAANRTATAPSCTDNMHMSQKGATAVFEDMKNEKGSIPLNRIVVPIMSAAEENILDKMLAECDEKKIPFEQYDFGVAYIDDVYDGDTYTIIALHHGVLTRFKVRLYGYNTPETRGPEKEFGIKVREYVRGIMEKKTVHINVLSNTYVGRRRISEKFGRLLANITVNGQDLGAHLDSLGFAKKYDGGFKEAFAD